MSKAVMFGEKPLILGFKGVGFEIIPVENSAQLLAELGRLSRDTEIGVVLITESMARDVLKPIAEFRENSPAIVTVIPTHGNSEHVGFEEMRKLVERSLGFDMLGKD